MLTSSKCIVANIQADDKKNSEISQKYEVTGFPTIKFFSKSSKKPREYTGGRTEADIVAFLNKECGTKRAVGGGLNDEVCCSVFRTCGESNHLLGWPGPRDGRYCIQILQGRR